MKATLCSLDLLNAMRNTTVVLRADPLVSSANEADHIHTLKIHIGIGIGSMLQVYVGSDGIEQGQRPRREFFIAGNAVVEAGVLLNNAKSGEVAMPSRAFALLKNHLGTLADRATRMEDATLFSEKSDLGAMSRQLQGSLATWMSTHNTPVTRSEGELGNADDDNLEIHDGLLPFLEESLAERISKATARRQTSTPDQLPSSDTECRTSLAISRPATALNRPWSMDSEVGQLRNVSVVFVRFSALSVESMDDPKTLSKVQTAFGIIMETLRRLDGCLRQFACDDKASSALIVFGLAGFAHEKGEEKVACLAAWEICAKLRVLMGSGFSIGVTSGTVFYGIVGNESRSDSTCMGAAVNLAARIMTHSYSAGRVVCDERTSTKSSLDFTFDPLPEVHFKGSNAPVKIFHLAKKGGAPVNEEHKEEKSEEGPERLFGRECEMTSMLEQVEKWVSGETVRLVVLGRSGSGKSALARWLKSSLEIHHGSDIIVGTAYGIDVMQNVYYHGLKQILVSVASQLSERLEDEKIAAKLRTASMLYKAIPALAHSENDGEFVNGKSDPGPELAIIIAATLANAFNKLTSALQLKLVLEIKASMKPGFAKLLSASNVLELNFLDEDSTIQLIKSQFVDFPVVVPDSIYRKIFECGQGNPLVSHTICQAVRADIRSLAKTKKTGLLAFESLSIPVDSTSAVIAQLDRLNPEFQTVLRVAAAHGQYFEIPIITSVIQQLAVFEGREDIITASYVQQLIREQDIFHFIIVSDEICSFSHFLIQQGILKSLTPSWLEIVHIEFVKFYETVLSDSDKGMVISSLLHHLMKITGEPKKKQKYLRAAFTIAAKLYRAAEGFEYYQMLEDLQLPRDLTLSEELNESMHLVHLYMQAGDTFTIFEVLQRSFKRLGFTFPLVKDGKGKTLRLVLKLFSRFMKIVSSTESTRRPLLYRTINDLFPEFLKEFNMEPNRHGQIIDDSKLGAMICAADDFLGLLSTNVYVGLNIRNGLEAVLLFLIRALICPLIGPKFDITKACITSQLNFVFYFDVPVFSRMLSRRQIMIQLTPEEVEKLDHFSISIWEDAHNWVGRTVEIQLLLNLDFMEYGRLARQSLFFTSRVVGDYVLARRTMKSILDKYTEIDVGECTYAETKLYYATIGLIDGSVVDAKDLYLKYAPQLAAIQFLMQSDTDGFLRLMTAVLSNKKELFWWPEYYRYRLHGATYRVKSLLLKETGEEMRKLRRDLVRYFSSVGDNAELAMIGEVVQGGSNM
ncbi:Adenylate cyclase type 10 [Irineochytrium annulatum]|nr:Adenylate cyclase type 10 [Irineochytrium annulatum]